MYCRPQDQFYNLYNAVSEGGYVIIDDYGIDECERGGPGRGGAGWGGAGRGGAGAGGAGRRPGASKNPSWYRRGRRFASIETIITPLDPVRQFSSWLRMADPSLRPAPPPTLPAQAARRCTSSSSATAWT